MYVYNILVGAFNLASIQPKLNNRYDAEYDIFFDIRPNLELGHVLPIYAQYLKSNLARLLNLISRSLSTKLCVVPSLL